MNSFLELLLPSCAIIFSILLIIVYYSKKRIRLFENNMYGVMLFCALADSILVLIEKSLVANKELTQVSPAVQLLVSTLNKFDAITLILLTTNLFIYIYYITLKPDRKKINTILNISAVIDTIIIIIIFVLDIHLITSGTIISITGTSLYPTYIACSVYIILSILVTLLNIKKITIKHIPLFTAIVVFILLILIFTFNPYVTIISILLTFVNYVMYFTIENPDMRLLEELHKSKEISDNANEEKTLFIYNLTQDIRNISGAIDDDADYILDSKNWDETYECARNIKYNTAKFITMTNDILDISTIDSANIKTYNSKYNVKNILKQIINVYSGECESKKIKFNTNIDHDVPEELYGDGIGLKGVLNIILSNSINYTEKGYIELSVNTIIKNNVCRLIFTIEDSGVGIKSEDIEKIKTDNTSLSKANKLISLMGGTMMISSEYGEGTKLKVVLDQKIEQAKNIEVDKYEEILDDIKVLAVDDSEAGLKIIEKLLKGSKVILTKVNTGKECIDKIKTGKYDLILLDEELSQITANELIVKIKEIRNFDTPVVLLTKDNSYEYNDEYIKNGFAGYILKPLKKEKLLEEINNFVRKGNLK